MFRTKIQFLGGMNLLGDLSGSQSEALFASGADLRTGVIRPLSGFNWEVQDATDPVNTGYFFTYRGKWYFSTAERHWAATFNQGSELVFWTEYGGLAMKEVNGQTTKLGLNPPEASLGVSKTNPVYATDFHVDILAKSGNLSAGQRFYRLAAKNAFGILPPTQEIEVQNAAKDANRLQWSYLNGISGWVVFASSTSGTEVAVVELPPSSTEWTDSGFAGTVGGNATDYDTSGTRVYIYTYKRTIGGLTDESGPSPNSYPLDFKHGVKVKRDPYQDGFFTQDGSQTAPVVAVSVPDGATFQITGYTRFSTNNAIRFQCDGPHNLNNGDLVYFGGLGWAIDKNYASKTFTAYVPDGFVDQFYLIGVPTPSSAIVYDASTTASSSTFIVKLDTTVGSFTAPAKDDAIYLNLGTAGSQVAKVVSYDPTTGEVSVTGTGITKVLDSDVRRPTSYAFTGTTAKVTGDWTDGHPFTLATDDDFVSYAQFNTTNQETSAQSSTLVLSTWEQQTDAYTSHVILKLSCGPISSSATDTITIEVSKDSGTTWTSLFTGTYAALGQTAMPMEIDLGDVTTISGGLSAIQVRFTMPVVAEKVISGPPGFTHGRVIPGVAGVRIYEIWTEAAISIASSNSTGTAIWVPGNNGITSWCVYRTGDTADFLLVEEVDIYTTEYIDTKPTLALGDAIPTFYNDGIQDVIYKPPPRGMVGLIDHNGSLMGIVDNTVRYTPTGQYDAWPDAYVATFDKRPSAVKSFNGAACVLLPDGVWRLDGNDPATYVLTKTAASDGCIAPNTVQQVRNKLVYLGPRGITVFDGMHSESISDRRMPLRYIMAAAGFNNGFDYSLTAGPLSGSGPMVPHMMTRAYEDAVAEFGDPRGSDTGYSDGMGDYGPGRLWDNTAAYGPMRYFRAFVYQGRYYLYLSNNISAPGAETSGFTDVRSWGCFVVDFESSELPITFMPLRIADAVVSEDQVLYWLARGSFAPPPPPPL